MARSGAWERDLNRTTSPSTFGFLPMVTIALGQTINRTLWAWSASVVTSTSAGLPTGSSLTRVGLIMRPPLATDVPLPISDPGADWMDIMTCRWTGSLALSTNVDWLVQAGFGGPDKEARAQRTCLGVDGLQLYVSWETYIAQDAVGPFAFTPTCSTDCYVLAAP